MGGRLTLSLHMVCEDSLLATPILLDLAIFMEAMGRMRLAPLPAGMEGRAQGAAAAAAAAADAAAAAAGGGAPRGASLAPIASALSFFFKAPASESGRVVHALFAQRTALFNLIRAAAGLPPEPFFDTRQVFGPRLGALRVAAAGGGKGAANGAEGAHANGAEGAHANGGGAISGAANGMHGAPRAGEETSSH
jgi:hypothetical protein